MSKIIINNLQTREIFHIEFLRRFIPKIDLNYFALKGGVNLRLFFQSIRYSEDIDIDVNGKRVRKDKLIKVVMDILDNRNFLDVLKTFGIVEVVKPNMKKAKQTDTTQRFKIHLKTKSGLDLFTKVEFSRRGGVGYSVNEHIPSEVLRDYKMAGFVVPHYEVNAAVVQKIKALAQRSETEARDIFDINLLSSRYSNSENKLPKLEAELIDRAHDNVFNIDFIQYREVVVKFLGEEDQKIYDSEKIWDNIQLKTAQLIEEYKNEK